MPQNWTFMGPVKVNNEISKYIIENDFFLTFREEADDESKKKESVFTICDDGKNRLYPWISYWPDRCRICGNIRCRCLRRPVPIQSLHAFTWNFFNGTKNPRKKGEVIHHKNRDKLDARIKNLGKGSQRVHGLAHKARRQKFSQRKRYHLGGLFRPHLPARVVSRPELIGTTIAPEVKQPPMPSKAAKLREVEYRLGARYHDLSEEMQHLDSGAEVPAIPVAEWRTPRTRMLGIHMPKLDPSPGESVFVLLLVKHDYKIDDIAAATGEHPDLLRALYQRPAVSHALGTWSKYRVLPLAP